MATKRATGAAAQSGPNASGPNGFIEISGNMLVVDHGKIFLDGSQVGVLFEDGLIQGTAAPLDGFKGLKTIEELPGVTFRGIDSQGIVLEFPSARSGPTGLIKYNNTVSLTVIHGRICTQDHKVKGTIDDKGRIVLRDHKNPQLLHELDENSQLNTVFQGLNSKGRPFTYEFVRPLHKKDRTYMDNEIIRYFEDYERLTTVQKNYVLETMKMWAASGILQIIRKSEGDAALGNVKHGASGVTGVRTGKVTLDKEEFEVEIKLYRQFGPIAKIQTRIRPYYEVRINLVVSHEFGHQLEFCLSQAHQDKIEDLYKERMSRCNKLHALPKGYEGGSELLLMHQIEERVFISGYSRASFHEYWAECVAAFSVKESREALKAMDPPVYEMLHEIIFSPEKSLSKKFEVDSRKLQTSLRLGGELTDDLLKH
jgi:hypothetical protein